MGIKNASVVKEILTRTFTPQNSDSECTKDKGFFLNCGEDIFIMDVNILLCSIFPTGKIYNVITWDDLRRTYVTIIHNFIKDATCLQKIILCIDNPTKVPWNKNFYKPGNIKLKDLKETDKEKITIGKGPIIPLECNDLFKFKERILKDKILKSKINGWLAACFIQTSLPKSIIDNNILLVIDAVPLKSIIHVYDTNPISELVKRGFTMEDYVVAKIIMNSGIIKRPSLTKADITGEGEIKAIKHINRLDFEREHKIALYSTDTDFLPIILMAMIDFINPSTLTMKKFVYLYDKNNVWDMYCLWNRIHDFFFQKFHILNNITPIETVSFLLILAGTDYNKSIPWITHEKIWDFFFEGGYKYLGKSSHSDDLKGYSSLDPYGSMKNSPDLNQVILSSSSSSSSSSSPSPSSHSLFVKYENAFTISENKIGDPYNRNITFHLYSKCIMNFISSLIKRKGTKKSQMTSEEMHICFLNIYWTLIYWKFCVKATDIDYEDPLKWGWKNEVSIYKNIEREDETESDTNDECVDSDGMEVEDD